MRRCTLVGLLTSVARPTALRTSSPLTHACVSTLRRRHQSPFCTSSSAFTAPADAVDTDPDQVAGAGGGPGAGGRQYLIDKHNDVLRLACPTPQGLQQGLLETQDLPHICIAGESNAGKSSLINHLLKKQNLAKASSMAGKTRSVDMMLVNEQVVLTDLPGLPSRDHQVAPMWEKSWRPLVFQYIRRCPSLHCMLYVHDVRWKVTSYVREFLADVEEQGLPVLLVLTKDDRIINELRPAQIKTPEAAREAEHALRQRLMTRVRRSLDFNGVHLHYSVDSGKSASRKARRRLLRYIESIVAAGSRDEARTLLDQIAADKFSQLGEPK